MGSRPLSGESLSNLSFAVQCNRFSAEFSSPFGGIIIKSLSESAKPMARSSRPLSGESLSNRKTKSFIAILLFCSRPLSGESLSNQQNTSTQEKEAVMSSRPLSGESLSNRV